MFCITIIECMRVKMECQLIVFDEAIDSCDQHIILYDHRSSCIICCVEHMAITISHPVWHTVSIQVHAQKLNSQKWNTSYLHLDRICNQFKPNVMFSFFALGDCNYFVYSLPRCNNQYRWLPKKILAQLIATKYKYSGTFEGKPVQSCAANNKQILQIWAQIVKIE